MTVQADDRAFETASLTDRNRSEPDSFLILLCSQKQKYKMS